MTVPIIPDLTGAPSAVTLDAASQALLSVLGGFFGSTNYTGNLQPDNFAPSAGFEAGHFRESKALVAFPTVTQDEWIGPLPCDLELLGLQMSLGLQEGTDNTLASLDVTPLVIGGAGTQFSESKGATWANQTALSRLTYVPNGSGYDAHHYQWELAGLVPAGAALTFRVENVTFSGGASHTNAIFFTLFGKVRLQPY